LTDCFHCGLPVPAGVDICVTFDGEPQPMCCHGCEAVTRIIIDSGCADFYRRRSAHPRNPLEVVPEIARAAAYDNPAIQAGLVEAAGDDLRRVSLILEGITCSACAWLIEHRLKRTPGVAEAYVNYNTHRATLMWDPQRLPLSRIVERIAEIGYHAKPFDPAVHEDRARRERKSFLVRIGVTGALGMQIMMIATAMYFGESGGMEQGHRELFRWVSLALAIPVIGYCALPFFRAAARDLGNATLGMDVPVALGLAVAFGGSVWATWTGTGSVYYESVAMFVFLLLCARFLEAGARHRSIATIESLGQALPDLAERRRPDGAWEPVLAAELAAGDVARVQPGSAFPADGRILDGATSANESLLTGEPTPIDKAPGSEVLAGSVNIDQPVTMSVSRPHGESVVSRIMRMTERAQSYKPGLARLADRAAAWFIGGVLLLALGSGVYWYEHGGADWLAVVISVLVVTCPCALSLATPAALTTAINALAGRSVVLVSGAALETLARVDTVLLDKTGTLTEGRFSVEGVVPQGPPGDPQATAGEVLRLAAALNQGSRHPVAEAVRSARDGPLPAVAESLHEAGGVSGVIEGTRYHIGNAAYVERMTGMVPGAPGEGSCAWLATGQRILARIDLRDRVRVDAARTVDALREAGLRVGLYSGDHPSAVAGLARRLRIEDWHGGMTPAGKLRAMRALQGQGQVVAAVGDGTNDAPFLSAADVSLAMAGGADLARVNADMVLVGDNLPGIRTAVATARRTRSIIRQNIGWAIGYNLLALPAAATGAIPPWLAAIGMSLSSLVVVANALRINLERVPRDRAPDAVPAPVPG